MNHYFRLFNIEFSKEISFSNIKLIPKLNVNYHITNENYFFATFTDNAKTDIDFPERINYLCLLLSICLRKYICWCGIYNINDDEKINLKKLTASYIGQETNPVILRRDQKDIITYIEQALNNQTIDNDLFNVYKALLFELSLTFEDALKSIIGRKLIRQWIVLESLVNYQFSSSNKFGDFIIDNEQFDKQVKKIFKKKISSLMKNDEKIKQFYESDDTRKFVYSKLDELNRYSFFNKWDWFIDTNKFSLDISKEEIKKINTLRNKLMHSGFIPKNDNEIDEIIHYEIKLENAIIMLFKILLIS